MAIQWLKEYNTGIEVIDEQHKRIVEYINVLETVLDNPHYERFHVYDVLNDIIDYTQSHFAFEESLQEQAGYQFFIPHKRVHDLFIRKIESYRERFNAGESIEHELHQLLCKWLINHIRHDDADYVRAVKENMIQHIEQQEKKKGKGWFARFFA